VSLTAASASLSSVDVPSNVPISLMSAQPRRAPPDFDDVLP
jgi:hypothetical protein